MGKKSKKSRTVGRRVTTTPVRTTPKSKAINPIIIGAVTFTMILVLLVTVAPQTGLGIGQSSPGTNGQYGATQSSTNTTQNNIDPAKQQQIANLEQTLKTDPKNVGVLIELGNSYYDTNQFGKAIDPYNKALDIDPNNTNVRTDLGTSYLQLGMVSQAIKEYKGVLKIDPQKPQAHLNLGNALVSDNPPSVDEAVSEWQKAIQYANGDADTIKKAQDQINKYKK